MALLFLTVHTTKKSAALSAAPLETININQNYEPYLPQVLSASSARIIAQDARPAIVDNFFKKYRSPMVGLGKDIVLSSDRYKIPYGYLPAIAQCEGNAGLAMPPDSYNTWGWAIYGELVTKFPNWQYAIDAVAKGLRREYFDLGLDTPEKIMPKYTPPSTGSWAFCVNKFLAELP